MLRVSSKAPHLAFTRRFHGMRENFAIQRWMCLSFWILETYKQSCCWSNVAYSIHSPGILAIKTQKENAILLHWEYSAFSHKSNQLPSLAAYTHRRIIQNSKLYQGFAPRTYNDLQDYLTNLSPYRHLIASSDYLRKMAFVNMLSILGFLAICLPFTTFASPITFRDTPSNSTNSSLPILVDITRGPHKSDTLGVTRCYCASKHWEADQLFGYYYLWDYYNFHVRPPLEQTPCLITIA